MTGRRQQRQGAARLLAVLALVLLLAPVAVAQTTTTPGPGTGVADALDAGVATGPDYAAWEVLANAADEAIDSQTISSPALEAMRAQIVDYRQQFQAAQSINANRIATLRDQMAALGPAPAEGATEAPEISARRTELTDQLNVLQAPGIAAGEAYRRADALIRQIDGVLRERQANELMELWPAPINPKNWPSAFQAAHHNWITIGTETRTALRRPATLETLRSRAPALVALALAGLVLIVRARSLMGRVASYLPQVASPRWVKVWSLLVSLAQMLLPIIGVLMLLAAGHNTGLLGARGNLALDAVASVGVTTLFSNWLARRMFPQESSQDTLLHLDARRRAEGRLIGTLMGLAIGLDSLREAMIDTALSGESAVSVISFPLLLVAGALLYRMGWLLRQVRGDGGSPEAAGGLQPRLIALLGRAAMVIGVIGPVLAAVGYVPAALAMVFPAVASLSVLAMLHVLQHLVDEIYDVLTGRSAKDRDALVPVLIGFVLAIATLPLLAVIWGARNEDLAELWTAFRGGFAIGETRIAPADFMVFAVVFLLGYGVTRLLQTALRLSVLPRTSLDLGARNALLAGIGYIGFFLAGLTAIHAAGINLSGLAIVAGALSVGIGFGLQNIVQNFVSGIILLVERPVSEGDWIEVAGVQGIVQSISVRSTRIQTFDRTDVIVPNGDLVSGQVTNWTRFSLTGRLVVPVSVAYRSDSREVERILLEIAEAEPLVVMNPAPAVFFMGFGADALNFEIRVILRDVNFSGAVRSEMNHQIVQRLREAGIDMPAPQREVWLHRGDDAPGVGPPPGTGAAALPPAKGSAPVSNRPDDDEDER